MAHYLEFPTADGQTILVEAEVEEVAPFAKGGPGEMVSEAVTKVQATFENSLDTVRRSAEAIIGKLRTLTDKPDEIQVTFGLKANGEFGTFVIAKAGLEANYTVQLTWKAERQVEGK
jgi:hypothetical protein